MNNNIINTPLHYLLNCIKDQQNIAQQVAELPWCECNCETCEVCCLRVFLIETQNVLQSTGVQLRRWCDELHNKKNLTAANYNLTVDKTQLRQCSCSNPEQEATGRHHNGLPFQEINKPVTPTTTPTIGQLTPLVWENDEKDNQ